MVERATTGNWPPSDGGVGNPRLYDCLQRISVAVRCGSGVKHKHIPTNDFDIFCILDC